MEHGVMIVSNRLPINIVERPGGGIAQERSIGGLATAMDAVAKRASARWVGWTGFARVLNDKELSGIRLPKRYVPVQAAARTIRGYYDHFANGYLWPVLHGKRPAIRPSASDWQLYQAMNQRFAEVVRRHVRPGEAIWIHDYHLMLLPQYLRELGVTNPIGYFLHVPFPKPAYWRGRSYGRQLAEGVAAADLIGMQRPQDVRRFRDYTAKAGITYGGTVKAFPIGVDCEAFRTLAARPAVRRLQRAIRSSFKGKRLVFSLSRMDYTKGILTQLKAARLFLRRHKRTAVYKLVVAPSRENLTEYSHLSQLIADEVRRINATLGDQHWQPVDYEHRTMGPEEVTAWYGASDVLLLLPDADGMNLIAKEYVAARHNDVGTLVLSTAAGSSDQLDQALLVPPCAAAAAAAALERAVVLPSGEQSRRWRSLRSAVQDQDIFWWTRAFLSRLERSAKYDII